MTILSTRKITKGHKCNTNTAVFTLQMMQEITENESLSITSGSNSEQSQAKSFFLFKPDCLQI